jgi:hypothetical protein
MDPDILRTDVTLFINNFYDRIGNHHKFNTIHLIRYEINFFSDFGNQISNLTIMGNFLSNFTSAINMECNDWNEQFYQVYKSRLASGIIDWFCEFNENFDKKCFMFGLIKKLLDTKTINFLSKDEYDMFKKIDNWINPIITYSVNKILTSIYSIWEANHSILIEKNNDHKKIFNKYNEILNKYKIPIYESNQLNFNNLIDRATIFSPNNYYKLLLNSTTNDNYDGYYEIFLYLKSYYDVISEYYKESNITDKTITGKTIIGTVKKTTKKVLNDNDEIANIIITAKVKKTTKKVSNNNITSNNLSTSDETTNDETTNGETTNVETTNDDTIITTKKTPKKTPKKSIPATLKRKVWNKYIGEDIGKSTCLCCKLSTITQLSFNCGHIIAESKGGELKMDNLKPICQSCNSSMGTMNMDEYMLKFGF